MRWQVSSNIFPAARPPICAICEERDLVTTNHTTKTNGNNSMNGQLPQLHMKRGLENPSDLTVPSGYELRTLRPGDVSAWASLLDENGELGEWDIDRAEVFFATGSRMPLEGGFFATKDGVPVATAQLHLHPDDSYAPMPELGWIAVSAEHRGRGLGSAMSVAVMRYAASIGHREIFLRTDDYRLPAIQMYVKLGFRPWMNDPTAPERWHAVFEKLGVADKNS